MINVIIDTNILVSGLLKGNTTRPIINAFIEKKFNIIISEEIKEELVKILASPNISKRIPIEDASQILELIDLNSIKVKPKEQVFDCRDSKDNKFLECAIESKADFVVTNDKDLLVLNPYKETRIVSAIEFLKLL